MVEPLRRLLLNRFVLGVKIEANFVCIQLIGNTIIIQWEKLKRMKNQKTKIDQNAHMFLVLYYTLHMDCDI